MFPNLVPLEFAIHFLQAQGPVDQVHTIRDCPLSNTLFPKVRKAQEASKHWLVMIREDKEIEISKRSNKGDKGESGGSGQEERGQERKIMGLPVEGLDVIRDSGKL